MHGRARLRENLTRGRLALHCAAILESVQDGSIAAGMKGRGDEAAVPSTSDAPGTVRTEAHAGSEAAAEQRVPKLARRSPEQSVPAGPLSRRLSKISADPIEILQALENLSEIISERVVREIRAFRREFESRLDVQDAKIDALYKLYDG